MISLLSFKLQFKLLHLKFSLLFCFFLSLLHSLMTLTLFSPSSINSFSRDQLIGIETKETDFGLSSTLFLLSVLGTICTPLSNRRLFVSVRFSSVPSVVVVKTETDTSSNETPLFVDLIAVSYDIRWSKILLISDWNSCSTFKELSTKFLASSRLHVVRHCLRKFACGATLHEKEFLLQNTSRFEISIWQSKHFLVLLNLGLHNKWVSICGWNLPKDHFYSWCNHC